MSGVDLGLAEGLGVPCLLALIILAVIALKRKRNECKKVTWQSTITISELEYSVGF